MYVCEWSITSAVVDEFAERLPGGDKETDWRVSWLPGRALTKDQAIAAMELVELLYDPTHRDEAAVRSAVAAAAERLSLRPVDIAATLSERHPPR
ncbi:hypothetical protein VMT65_37025 [Nocardia sp. CDC153]|uniref:hypothetical protein n=1 Tax=Nocardia sp. CDC153 TaxID=3112167 RepID=UPI002DB58D06|nr:hypothetical protein [Nocardia sp. CDC153]MEC3958689.1 hypothetical protein [Nocardia sp. CDC153]